MKFVKYWSEYNVYISCTTILDPRFKVKFVEYCLMDLFGDDKGLEFGPCFHCDGYFEVFV